MGLHRKTEQVFFIVSAVVVFVFFLWSRIDFSNRIYYFGDGNTIIELIRLMVANHDWDPNWVRLKDVIHIQAEMLTVNPAPDNIKIFYNLSGYTVIGAAIYKTVVLMGLPEIPIQVVLRVFNVLLQLATILLLFSIGKKLFNRYVGMLTVVLYVVFPLIVMEAHYERPEVWLCFLATALLYCCICFYNSPIRYSLLMGMIIGLSAATKINQLFLGLMPAIVLCHYWMTSRNKIPHQTTKLFLLYGSLILFSLAIAVAINAPFLIYHATETIAGVKNIAGFYTTPTYPYSEEHYFFTHQFFISLQYFWFTLGSLWCIFLVIGIIFLIKSHLQNPVSAKAINLVIVAPILFLFIYSAFLINFVERTFSSIEGILCLVTAIGFVECAQKLQRLLASKKMALVLIAAIFSATVVTPLHIDFLFINRYIKHAEKPPRIHFQESLKNDFSSFWIKNVFFTLKLTGDLPEKPEKAPRIYQIDDLNEHWTRDYLEKLEQNGFKKIGVYCSEFSNQPQNTLTIYHAAAKNHYYVRDDEWPADVAKDYFKTNCQ